MNLRERNIAVLKAIKEDDVDFFKSLVGHDPEYRNGANVFGSWLHIAAQDGATRCIEYLLENGADVNLRDNCENDALNHAIRHDNLSIAERLLVAGTVPDLQNVRNNPFFTAIINGHLHAVQWLIEKGFDPHISPLSPTGKHRNLLDFAYEQGKTDIARYLESYGCKRSEAEVRSSQQAASSEDAHPIIAKLVNTIAAKYGAVDALSLSELLPIDSEVSVSIHVIRPNPLCPYLTLFTTGMCGISLPTPVGMQEYQHVELMMHLPPQWPLPSRADSHTQWPIEWLRKLAYAAHINQNWLGPGKTVVSPTTPPSPLAKGVTQTSFLLISRTHVELDVEDTRVYYFTCIPIYTSELQYAKSSGIDALICLFEQTPGSMCADPDRVALV